ncbi:hypothetical protein PRIPAC_78131 [Pristionchus pacificus]|uniref:G protein-coupled receptor n=1 Tax=Pristionchus pacificus TaxID=54126 RepID=A0A2A6BEI6_PRIPA|nr:hypothetical protein PRIPAC_78131 [Pristionchus pacificus]|eukprot:PDM64221.1 G protein-coupled receptor [Pristionchus pacificus]
MNTRSMGTMRFQKQLFKCLIYQTVIPLITAYFPVGICIFAPIAGFAWPPLAFLFPNICCIHPLFDGLVVMFTVTEYRLFVGVVCFTSDEESKLITRRLMNGEEWSPIIHSKETEELEKEHSMVLAGNH